MFVEPRNELRNIFLSLIIASKKPPTGDLLSKNTIFNLRTLDYRGLHHVRRSNQFVCIHGQPSFAAAHPEPLISVPAKALFSFPSVVPSFQQKLEPRREHSYITCALQIFWDTICIFVRIIRHNTYRSK